MLHNFCFDLNILFITKEHFISFYHSLILNSVIFLINKTLAGKINKLYSTRNSPTRQDENTEFYANDENAILTPQTFPANTIYCGPGQDFSSVTSDWNICGGGIENALAAATALLREQTTIDFYQLTNQSVLDFPVSR
ncbi:hypothetical protein CDAR_289221 [Caerostris darwini]|uniref:Uncharacterized protein n=1 Tax=Caerostris darwini TaxID=1538125 RepID=A0AAV4PIV1_9ARAC|nr:hypothetical protein CDAR_289221 [Caerostris darwini]